MLGLLEDLATKRETDMLRLDRCLILISELPQIRSLMGEEDDKADGMESEVGLVDSNFQWLDYRC